MPGNFDVSRAIYFVALVDELALRKKMTLEGKLEGSPEGCPWRDVGV